MVFGSLIDGLLSRGKNPREYAEMRMERLYFKYIPVKIKALKLGGQSQWGQAAECFDDAVRIIREGYGQIKMDMDARDIGMFCHFNGEQMSQVADVYHQAIDARLNSADYARFRSTALMLIPELIAFIDGSREDVAGRLRSGYLRGDEGIKLTTQRAILDELRSKAIQRYDLINSG